MKIQCDACEKAPATLICCADEAALCADCDVEIHAANKLASKHQRLLLECLSDRLPRCDICQEKTAFIFCVEDRALFCRDCDEPIHAPGSLSGNHQRLLATGIRVALSSACAQDTESGSFEPPNQNTPLVPPKPSSPPPHNYPSPLPWPVDDFLHLPVFEPNDKKEANGFGLEWLNDIGLFDEQVPQAPESLAAAEVPQLRVSTTNNPPYYRPAKSHFSPKKPRIETSDDEEYFTVPDLD
ncbi:B-box zinc finger protein 24-like [Aristolochia californica]|uniref:B-box zinc finger protein 24-like n=1 Tax=Aristolochia californica TaxID=171875 RepID=UPI0035DC7944